jgi:hypothetical protein
VFSANMLLLNFSIVVISAAVIIVPGIVLAYKDALLRSPVSAMPFSFNSEHSRKAV